MFVTAESFDRHLDHLARRRTVVPLEAAVAGASTPRPPVALTFDDAYRSFFRIALPALERRGFPAALFVPSGRLGGTNTWDEDSSCDRTLMTSDEVAAAAARGVEIASHGHMHVDLTTGDASADLTASVEALTAITGTRSRFLAYPWGRHDAEARAAAEAAGFDAAFAVNVPAEDRFGLERVQIEGGDGAWLLALKTSGAYSRVRRLVRQVRS